MRALQGVIEGFNLLGEPAPGYLAIEVWSLGHVLLSELDAKAQQEWAAARTGALDKMFQEQVKVSRPRQRI